MFIYAYTSKPQELKDKILKDGKDSKFDTWQILQDANQTRYLTHTSAQWNKIAMIRMSADPQNKRLTIGVTRMSNWDALTDETIAMYLTMFAYQLMTRYADDYATLQIFK